MTSPERAPPAVVIGLDCPTGLQTARLLSELGAPVDGVADDGRHPCSRTRACRRLVEADTGGAELLDALSRLGDGGDGPGRVLVPCTDRSVLFLSRNRDAVAGEHRLILPDPGLLEALLDKALFVDFARDRGLPVPPSRILRTRDDAAAAAADLPFPCALKPNRKTAAWRRRTDAKLFRAERPGQLVELYDRSSGWARTLVAQSWVPGPDTHHLTCNAYFGAGGEMIAAHTSRKLRQWPRNGGQGCLSESWPDDTVRRITGELFGSVDYRGLAYLETKWDPRADEHVILETNVGRPTGRSAAARASGVPLLETAYRDAAGLDLPVQRAGERRGVKWIHLRRDVQASVVAVGRGELGPSGWLRSLRGPRVHALLSRRDPLPFVLDLARSARKAVSRALDRLSPGTDDRETDSGDDIRRRGRDGGGSDRGAGTRELGGGLTVRIRGAGPHDAAGVRRRTGPPAASSADPDLVVRFADRLEAPGLRHAEWGRFGFTDEALYLLDSPGGEPVARLAPPAETDPVELRCRRGRGQTPPLFEELVDLAALRRGLLPLHASAVVHGGRGAIVAGPAHSGKTGTLLAFGQHGARFVADDRVLLDPEDDSMSGLRAPLTVRDWHLRQLPELRRRLPLHRRALSRALRAADGTVPPGLTAGRGRSRRWLRRARAGMRRRLAVEMTPEEVFGPDRCLPAAAPDAVFVLVNQRDDEIVVEPAAPAEAARMLSALVEAEMEDLLEARRACRFAFPGAGWPVLDDLRDRVARTLEDALREKEAFVVRHPHPCSLQHLYGAMRAALTPGHGTDRPEAPVSARDPSGSPGVRSGGPNGRDAGPAAPAAGGAR